jgi:hypothetical protein
LLFVPVALAGGGAAQLAFDPSAGTLGPIDSGQTTSQTFTLTNSGGRSAGTVTISLSGSDTFSISDDSCTGNGLGPNRSCSVTVQYAPSADGATDTAALQADGEHGYQATASLTGTSTSSLYPDSQSVCESYGGTFSTDPSSNQVTLIPGFSVLWSCNGQTGGDTGRQALLIRCGSDASHAGASFYGLPTSGYADNYSNTSCEVE